MEMASLLAPQNQSQSEQTETQYWCHICGTNVSVVQQTDNEELECCNCHRTFVEEIGEAIEGEVPAAQFNAAGVEQGAEQVRASAGVNTTVQSLIGQLMGAGVQMIVQENGPGQGVPLGLEGLAGGIVGNPGDYVVGNGALQNLLHALLQSEGSASTPTSKQYVESMEKRKVSEELAASEHECAVCKDSFEMNQEYSTLPCDHMFHPDCVTPWLTTHNTCPVCRFELPTE